MKLEAGKARYPIPDHDSVVAVVVNDEDQIHRFMICLHKPESLSKDKTQGFPRHCAVYDNEIEFWPVPDKPYNVRLRYLPPAIEI